MTKKTAVRIGIASRAQMKARTLAVARGEHKRAPDGPKVWFTSVKSLSDCLAGSDVLRAKLTSRLNQR